MEPEAEQAETTRMTLSPPGNVDCTNVKQDDKQNVAAISWILRRGRCCKKCFQLSTACWLVCGLVVGFLIALALKPIPHDGKFPCEQCPSGWIHYKTKCYFLSEKEENWTSSQTFCSRNESWLAVFENQEEMHSLAKHLKIDDSWIGLRKKGQSFYWDDGTAFKEDSFQIWNHSECAYLDGFTISTSACSLPRRWICFRFPK